MRILRQSLAAVAILLIVLCAADFLVWRRAASGGAGFDSVQVARVSIATLKGSKEEYYADGSETVQCARSILPMPAAGDWFAPCWWRRQHRSVEVRY